MGRVLTTWPRSNYGTVLADPPWPLRGGKNGRQGYSKTMSADVQYPLMSFRQIRELRVQDVAMPDSHLYLWAVSMYLPEALDVMRAWGFRYVTNLAWYMDDNTLGVGQYFRTKHQLCLFGVKGKPGYQRTGDGRRITVESAFAHHRMRHSQKPGHVHGIAEVASPAPRLELFARERRTGWDAWGNELLSRG